MVPVAWSLFFHVQRLLEPSARSCSLCSDYNLLSCFRGTHQTDYVSSSS
jgi:hypothetical protein